MLETSGYCLKQHVMKYSWNRDHNSSLFSIPITHSLLAKRKIISFPFFFLCCKAMQSKTEMYLIHTLLNQIVTLPMACWLVRNHFCLAKTASGKLFRMFLCLKSSSGHKIFLLSPSQAKNSENSPLIRKLWTLWYELVNDPIVFF